MGRTARAGKAGTAVTIVDEEEHRNFKKIIKSVNRQTSNLNRINIDEDKLTDLLPKLTKALQNLPAVLKVRKCLNHLKIIVNIIFVFFLLQADKKNHKNK